METGSNVQDLLDQFINVTGVDQDRAKFYLESAAWNLQVALGSFYEEGEGDFDVENQAAPPIYHEETPKVTTSSFGPQAAQSEDSALKPPLKQPSRFGTLSGLHNDNSSDEEDGQAFYAGGSERSGQQILGPGKKPKDDLVSNMFKAAKEHGAEVVPATQPDTSIKPAPFKGTGYRLGGTENDSEVVPSTSIPPNLKPKSRDVVLKMWKTGFSVDDGPFREFSDPANRDFLDSIGRGETPSEVMRETRGSEVNLIMEDHRLEDYTAAEPTVKVFSGAGQMLGSPVPRVLAEMQGTVLVQDRKQNEGAANRALNVDASQPTTNVQIRLADGSRVVVTLNHNHTIGDLRKYITIARPQYAASLFSLMTTFPNRELSEDKISLKDANLLNSVVMQRIQ